MRVSCSAASSGVARSLKRLTEMYYYRESSSSSSVKEEARYNLVAKNGCYGSNMCSSEEKAGAFQMFLGAVEKRMKRDPERGRKRQEESVMRGFLPFKQTSVYAFSWNDSESDCLF